MLSYSKFIGLVLAIELFIGIYIKVSRFVIPIRLTRSRQFQTSLKFISNEANPLIYRLACLLVLQP